MCVHACMRAEPLIKERKLYHHSLECYRMLVVIVLNHRNVCVHACMRAEPLIKVRKLYHHSLECYRVLVVIVLNHRNVCVRACMCAEPFGSEYPPYIILLGRKYEARRSMMQV